MSLKHKVGSAETLSLQFNIVEQFIQQFGQNLEQGKKVWAAKVSQLKKIITKGQSRFEWVDSVLVKAITSGDWVIFENANLCNPSILDRLNSLLEEGNNSMSINEQGLVDGDKLREVKCHPEFRAIFLVSRETLIDQGRDVSRALRNRCISIEFMYSHSNLNDLLVSEMVEL